MAIFLFYLLFGLLFVWQIESLPMLAVRREWVEIILAKGGGHTCFFL
jgi:hypothetical protein